MHDSFRLSPSAPVGLLGKRHDGQRTLGSGPVSTISNRMPQDRWAIRFSGDAAVEYLEASHRLLETDISEMTVIIWYRVATWAADILACEWPATAAQDSWIIALAPANGGFPATTPTATTRVYLNAPASAGFAITEHANSEVLNDWVQLVHVFRGGASGNNNISQLWRAVGNDTHISRLPVTHNFDFTGLVAYSTQLQRPTTSFFTMGARGDQPPSNKTDYLTGQIAEVAWFDKALDYSEIQATRKWAQPADLMQHPARTRLHYWFRMGDSPGDAYGVIKNAATYNAQRMVATGNTDPDDLIAWRRS